MGAAAVRIRFDSYFMLFYFLAINLDIPKDEVRWFTAFTALNTLHFLNFIQTKSSVCGLKLDPVWDPDPVNPPAAAVFFQCAGLSGTTISSGLNKVLSHASYHSLKKADVC